MKTASRIVGTAAFGQGYYAQDSPVYGAERRGAPMIAFTRFHSRPSTYGNRAGSVTSSKRYNKTTPSGQSRRLSMITGTA